MSTQTPGSLWQLYSRRPTFGSKHDVLSQVKGQINCGTSRQKTREKKSAIKKNNKTTHEKTWRKLNKRSQSEKAIYCMVSSIWHSEKGKTMERVKRSVAARGWGEMWQGEGWTGENSPEDFQGSKHILHDTLKMDTCHYTFIQTHRMWKTNMTQNISPGLWVMMTPM